MKKISVLILTSLLVYISIFPIEKADAAEFSQAFIRLDRTKSNSSLSGTICASPSSPGAGVENKIIIYFPIDFAINNNPSNFTTYTTNLPAGATTWPGISNNATQIAGNDVTLASNDLTTSSLYCFNFSANSSTTGANGNKSGTIETRNSSNAIIDLSDYGVNINSNDQIKITAVVPAKATDYFINLNLLNPPHPGGAYSEGTQLEYRISYGSRLNYPTSIIIQAIWSRGTIEDQIYPSENILDYIGGSASNAYGSTPPIINTLNRTISWSIPALPGNSGNQTVVFKLLTKDSFKQDKKINFNVSSKTYFTGGVTPISRIFSSYKHSSYNPSPTSTNTSTQTIQSPIPLTLTPPIIQNIDVREISENAASIFIKTNTKTSKTIKYGTSINSLSKQVTVGSTFSDNLELKDLIESTQYYFRTYVTDENGKQTISDLYTFTTAKNTTPLLVDIGSLVAASRNTIISPFLFENYNYLVIPVNTPIQFKFSILNKNIAKNIQAIVRNKNLLGDSTFFKSSQENLELIDLIEVENDVYSGNILSGPKPGNFELFARIIDSNGNLKEQKIADLKVINKFKVISNDNFPIERARILISIYNTTSRTYQLMPSDSISGGNPLYTNSKGELDLVLPQGRFKAEVSDLRHNGKTVEFEIGPEKGQNYPEVNLEKTGITAPNLINYYRKGISDVFILNTKNYSKSLTGSSLFFDLVALLSLAGLVILTLFAFSKRHHVPLSKIPSYFYYLLDKKSKNDKYIHGVVYDENDNPIPSANVYLTDKIDEKIISSTKTNKRGEFFFRKKSKLNEYFIMAMAINFKPSPVLEYHEKEHLKFRLTLEEETKQPNLVGHINHMVSVMIGLSFEVLLLASFVFELLFLNSFGLLKTLPFLLISTFNLVIWTLHQKNK